MMWLDTKTIMAEHIDYKVVIPSAGLGTRLGSLTKNLNKALVSVDNKPVISHIIEKFPTDIEIVIAVGYKKEVLIDYLKAAHNNRKITTVNIDKYMGDGSGLGYTLLKCCDYLQCPFVFCTNDTLTTEDIPEPNYDWAAYSSESFDSDICRSIEIEEHLIKSIQDKGNATKNSLVYIGLCGIYNYKQFWSYMKNGVNHGSITLGETYGLLKLLQSNKIYAKEFTWKDTGCIESLNNNRSKSINLQKDNEEIWMVGDRVVKYNTDNSLIKDKIHRAKYLDKYIPEITYAGENIYAYEKVVGRTLEEKCNEHNFDHVLSFLSDEFWIQQSETLEDYGEFYRIKAQDRISKFLSNHKITDGNSIINDIEIPSIESLLDKINWEDFKSPPFQIHGDLHPSNILISENNDIVLIDWRQSFANSKNYGDIHYDFAKLAHGLIISHQLIKRDMFTISRDNNIIDIDIFRTQHMVNCERILEKKVSESTDYSWRKIELLKALIWLSSCPLHEYPYSEFLFYMGKYSVYKWLINGNCLS